MGFAHYVLPDGREAGYAVRAACDATDCTITIDRGLDYLCRDLPDGHRADDAPGCGRYFCSRHADRHDCPKPACGQWPHDEVRTEDPCALLAGHDLPHRDLDGCEFVATEYDDDPDLLKESAA